MHEPWGCRLLEPHRSRWSAPIGIKPPLTSRRNFAQRPPQSASPPASPSPTHSGGAALGRLGAPLVLVAGTSMPASASNYLISIDVATTTGYLVGGINTVSAPVLTAVQTALGT